LERDGEPTVRTTIGDSLTWLSPVLRDFGSFKPTLRYLGAETKTNFPSDFQETRKRRFAVAQISSGLGGEIKLERQQL
jgi:hypothetical protein